MDGEKQKIVDFLQEIEKLKLVERKMYTSGGSRESTPEHTWHMCMYALLFGDGKLDMLKLVKMVLVHDLVEVYAGDASVWDKKAREGKKKREQKAAEKLFGMLPRRYEKEFMGLWYEFEDCITSEAKSAKIFDGLQAVGQQISSGGMAWKEQGVTLEMLKEKAASYGYGKDKTIDKIWEEFFQIADERNMFADK